MCTAGHAGYASQASSVNNAPTIGRSLRDAEDRPAQCARPISPWGRGQRGGEPDAAHQPGLTIQQCQDVGEARDSVAPEPSGVHTRSPATRSGAGWLGGYCVPGGCLALPERPARRGRPDAVSEPPFQKRIGSPRRADYRATRASAMIKAPTEQQRRGLLTPSRFPWRRRSRASSRREIARAVGFSDARGVDAAPPSRWHAATRPDRRDLRRCARSRCSRSSG